MKTIKILIAIIALTTLALLTGCSGGGTGTPGDAKVGLKVVFANTSSAGTMQTLGINAMYLDVIPSSASSFAPPTIDLFAYHQQTHTFTYPLTNLTDNETYLFRIRAYNGSTMVYSGQTGARLLPPPASNDISLTAYNFSTVGAAAKGFSGAVGTYDGTTSDGSTFTLTVNSLGIGTGVSNRGVSITSYITPAASGNYDVFVFSRGTAGTTFGTGTLSPSGSGSGSGTDPSGNPVNWTIALHKTNFASVAGTYDGSALDTNLTVADTFTFTIDSSGNVSGTSNRGYAIAGKLTSPDTVDTFFTYSGTSTSGSDVINWTGSTTSTGGIISGTYTGTTAGTGTWSATKRVVSTGATALAVMQSGMYSPQNRTYQSVAGGFTTVYAIERVALAANNSDMTSAYTYYDKASNTWTTTAPTGTPPDIFGNGTVYFLTAANGWQPGFGGPQSYTFVSNSDGSATITNKIDASSANLVVTAVDISGQTIASQGPEVTWWPVLTTAGPFPSGSTRYNMTWTNVTERYELWGSATITVPTGTPLSQVPTYVQQAFVDSNDHKISYYAQFATTGQTVDFYQLTFVTGQTTTPTPVLIGSGTYAITLAKGQDILEITIPPALRTQYKLGGNPIFGTVNGTIYEGVHSLPGISFTDGNSGANKAASDHLKNSFDGSGVAKGSVTATW